MENARLKWVALMAEVIASVAVVISLIFVVVSINQNTSALQAINDNFLYELQNQRLSDVSLDAGLASIIFRHEEGRELTETDLLRYRFWIVQELNMWELAFLRNQEGLLPDNQWETWNAMWTASMPDQYELELWMKGRYQYDPNFAKHVDAAYAQQD